MSTTCVSYLCERVSGWLYKRPDVRHALALGVRRRLSHVSAEFQRDFDSILIRSWIDPEVILTQLAVASYKYVIVFACRPIVCV